MKTQINVEDFKLIKSFYPDFIRKPLQSNDFIIGWSELMPVVQKCFDTELNSDFDSWKRLNDNIIASLVAISIEGVFNSIVEFIKWYNKQLK